MSFLAAVSSRRLRLAVWLSVLSLICLLCIDRSFCHAATAEFEGFGDDSEDVTDDAAAYSGGAHKAASGADPSFAHQWDEDEFEVAPPPPVAEPVVEQEEEVTEEEQPEPQAPQQQHYYWEMLGVAFLVLYGINIWLGRTKNENLAIAWAKYFTTDNSILEKNFALIGPGDTSNGEVLMKESQSCFKFYASGRRYCDGLLATLDMRQRQDLLSLLVYLINPKEDTISIEVNMSESSMPPVVLAVGTPKLIRNMLRDETDLATYTKQISVPKDGLRFWPNDRLHVLTEHSSVFYDIFSDPRVEQAFAEGPKLFRSLHFTSEASGGSHKRLLKFVFALPRAERMEDLTKLMQLVPLFIDIIGTYKMSAEVRKKAVKARAEEEEKAFKSGAKARQEALLQKKIEKMQAEKERLAKMNPEARAKWEEKQQAKMVKKATKIKMLKA